MKTKRSTKWALCSMLAASMALLESQRSAALVGGPTGPGGFAAECMTVSPGSGGTATGSLFNLGQALAGTSASRTQAISFGVVPCLAAGPQTPVGCVTNCGDIDASGGIVNLVDFASFAVCFGQSPSVSTACACSDLNDDGAINLADFATFTLIFNGTSTNSPPNCP